jgi:hypothetical protein
VATSCDFHAVHIARTVPVRATPEDFQPKAILLAAKNLAEGNIANE